MATLMEAARSVIEEGAKENFESSKAKGAKEPSREKVGQITKTQLEEIARQKMTDLNTTNLEMAMHSIAGTARSMGVDVVD